MAKKAEKPPMKLTGVRLPPEITVWLQQAAKSMSIDGRVCSVSDVIRTILYEARDAQPQPQCSDDEATDV